MHYIMAEETTRRFKMLSTRECPCDQYDELCFQFMRGVRFLGGNNFRKDKINNKPDKILRMCSSLAIVLCLRRIKFQSTTSHPLLVFTPVQLTTNAIFMK